MLAYKYFIIGIVVFSVENIRYGICDGVVESLEVQEQNLSDESFCRSFSESHCNVKNSLNEQCKEYKKRCKVNSNEDTQQSAHAKGEAQNSDLIIPEYAAKPQKPESKPQKPGNESQKPGSKPQKPGTKPQKPGSKPQKPGSKPQKPGNKPQKPANKPQKPGNKPQKPGNEPQKPGSKPQKPGTKPQKPGSKPQKPGSKPQKPGNKPQKPGNKPQKPGNKPQKPESKPQKPGNKPQKPAKKPQKPSKKPEKPANEQPVRPVTCVGAGQRCNCDCCSGYYCVEAYPGVARTCTKLDTPPGECRKDNATGGNYQQPGADSIPVVGPGLQQAATG